MRLLDSRRLTGPNMMTGGPAVIAEVGFDAGEDPSRVIAAWKTELHRMLGALSLPPPRGIFVREFKGGAALVFEAPLDILLPATEVNDWALASGAELAAGRAAFELEPRRSELADLIGAARSDALLGLKEEARRRGLPFLLDDKAVTIGMAKRSRTWPRGQEPRVDEVPWNELGAIPVALITGTNGKTTSTRLVARIARAAGFMAGSTSTDGVAVDGEIVEKGDYTGPAGALAVLRRPEVQVAVLETARGGILRRGLAVDACDGALITNVSADHLGDYGIDDLETMVRVKAVITSVARTVVLNAEDPSLVRIGVELAATGRRVVWFALDRATMRERFGTKWYVSEDRVIVRERDGAVEEVVRVDEVPISFNGRARYNVENSLGAAALSDVLGFDLGAVRAGLTGFKSSSADNPGRGNIAELPNGVKVLVDFGHNPAGVEKVLAFARALSGGAISVISGMPGDRLDDEMIDVASRIAKASPRRVYLRELVGYLRGREPGVVPEILRRGLIAGGLPADRVGIVETEAVALADALRGASAGEVIAILPSLEGAAVRAIIEGAGGRWLEGGN